MSKYNNSIYTKYKFQPHRRRSLVTGKRPPLQERAKIRLRNYLTRFVTARSQLLQNTALLARIIELSEIPALTAQRFRSVNKTFRQASIIAQQGQSLKTFSAQELLDAFSSIPSTRVSSSLRLYIDNTPHSPLPDIDILLSLKDFSKDDIRSALYQLQKTKKTSSVKAVVELNHTTELKTLIVSQLPYIHLNQGILRSIRLKENVSFTQLQNDLLPEVLKLRSQFMPSTSMHSKAVLLEVSVIFPSIAEFLDADLGFTQHISLHVLTLGALDFRPFLLDKSQELSLQTKLNSLSTLKFLILKQDFSSNISLTIPLSVERLSCCNFRRHLTFHPSCHCTHIHISFVSPGTFLPSTTNLSIFIVRRGDNVTIPSSVINLTTGSIYGTMLFAPNSQCSAMTVDWVTQYTSISIPPSVKQLQTANIDGTILFEPNSQCVAVRTGNVEKNATLTIPPSVEKLKTADINGRLILFRNSKLSTLTIYDITYTGQQLLDIKSGKTTLENITFS